MKKDVQSLFDFHHCPLLICPQPISGQRVYSRPIQYSLYNIQPIVIHLVN